MQEYRYSLGLLELATGIGLLVLALYTALVQPDNTYPLLRLVIHIVAAPLLFWIMTQAQARLSEDAKLATFTLSVPTALAAFGFFLLVPLALSSPMLNNQNFSTISAACIVSGGMILFGGTGPRIAYPVGGIMLLGLGLTLFAPAPYATILFCILVSLILIPAGIVTLHRELPG